MKHKLNISVSKTPAEDGIISCKTKRFPKGCLKKLFGTSKKMTILIPGDSVEHITISEVDDEGGAKHGTKGS